MATPPTGCEGPPRPLHSLPQASYHTPVPSTATSPAQRLKATGLKRTPVRLAVLDLLARAPAPLAAPQVLGALPRTTDSVTVYRTLNTLTDKKLLHRVRGDDRVWRYALSENAEKPRHNHAHFVCEECGNVECLKDVPLPQKLLDQLAPRKQYRVSYSEVLVHGRCPNCPD